ncbi:Methionyl-tRNA formyltransferase [compost metagenome]
MRGLHPWPVAYTTFEDGHFKIWWATIGKSKHEANPGTVVAIEKDHFVVAAGNGTTLALYDVQPAGKKRMTAEEYLRGTGSKLQIGDQFQ